MRTACSPQFCAHIRSPLLMMSESRVSLGFYIAIRYIYALYRFYHFNLNLRKFVLLPF